MALLDLAPHQHEHISEFAGLIVIQHPMLNSPDNLIDYTTPKTTLSKLLVEHMKASGILPELYPYAVDLFAGNAPISEMLVQQGWLAKNVTCIDQFLPTKPRVDGAIWNSWNLGMLGVCLERHETLPQEVEQYRGKYDLAIATQAHQDQQCLSNLMDFFVRPGGFAYTDSHGILPAFIDSGKWQEDGSFYQKLW